MRKLGCVVVLVLAGCGGGSKAGKGPAKTTPATRAITTAPADTMTLKTLEPGDVACYVTVVTGAGEERTMDGDFDLCPGGSHDATPLLGQPVAITTKKSNVLAASCEGNMDCGKSDEVDLVVTITPTH